MLADAGVGHRPRGGGKRTGDAEHHRRVFQAVVEPGRIGEVEYAPGQAERFGDGLELRRIATRQDGRKSFSCATRAMSLPV